MRANSHFRSSKSAGLGLVTSGDTVAVGSGWRAGTGVFVTHSISTSLRADGTIRTHAGKDFGGSIAANGTGSAVQTDALFPHPRTGKAISMRGLLARLRAAGIEPHPFGEAGDGAFVEALQGGSTSEEDEFATDSVDSGFAPRSFDAPPWNSLFFGADSARFAWPSETDNGEDYGYFWQVLADIKNARGGYFREGLSNDLTWDHIFTDTEIPQPAQILDWLRADGRRALSHFHATLIAAITTGVRLFPTVFARGGGEGLNPDTHSPDDPLIHPATGVSAPMDGSTGVITYERVAAGKPAHQVSYIIPSVMGWHPWYWDLATSDGTAEEILFEQFALNVYNDDPDAAGQPAPSNTYAGKAALRKSLALAAFGQGIGEALEHFERVIARDGLVLLNYLPHLELGAENDAQWAQSGEVGPNEVSLDASAISVLELQPLFRASAREYARFHGVLAASIRQAWPSARFKASELASWAVLRSSACRSAWLGRALAEGLADEADMMNLVIEVADRHAAGDPDSDLGSDYAAAIDWVAECEDCGYSFPAAGSSAISAPDLVHVVGFHYFHYWVYLDESDPGYQNEEDMDSNTFRPFATYVLSRCRSAGLTLTWGVGNVGFPSGDTEVVEGETHLPAYATNTQMIQAGMLVRSLLTFVAYGADHVLWYSHIGAKEGGSGGEFGLMGLRHDDPAASGLSPDPAADDAWEKASWWAFRRLAGLAARATSAAGIEVIYNRDGIVVLRLEANATGFVLPGTGSDPGVLRWQYAFLFWVDGLQAATDMTWLSLSTPDGFERVPLVPEDTSKDAYHIPYAHSTAPDWDDGTPLDAHFGHCTQVFRTSDDGLSTWIDVYRTLDYSTEASVPAALSNPKNLGLVAWLTNGPTCDVLTESPDARARSLPRGVRWG